MMYNIVSFLKRNFCVVSFIGLFIFCAPTQAESITSFSSEELQSISSSMKNKAYFFIGYPGSGKGTQGKKVADLLNISHLSTGELFRAEAKRGTAIGQQMDYYMQRGEIIPKEVSFQYLKQELSNPKYRNGFILDGYPKDLECFHFITDTLKELGVQPTFAFYFDISREGVIHRLTSRLHCEGCERDYHKELLKPKVEGVCDVCHGALNPRPDDREEAIQKRLNVFEKNTRSVVHNFSAMGILVDLDAEKDPAALTQDILQVFFQDIEERKSLNSEGSYYLRKPREEEKSSVFHNHIDAENHELLKELIKEIEGESLSFQDKIYPVGYLFLGPQVSNPCFASIYNALPNFHFIDNSATEAFSTGKMGEEGFNYFQVLTTLEVASKHPNRGVMTELEEEVFAKDFDGNGFSTVILDRGHSPYIVDFLRLPGWKDKMIQGVPKFELHHGFDLVKLDGEEVPPIELSQLSAITNANGFETGGWFVFKKKGHWAYRSNEFSNDEYQNCIDRLDHQANQLRRIVLEFLIDRPFTSSASLEKVHAMWCL